MRIGHDKADAMSTITLTLAVTPDERRIVQNFFVAYFYEMSQFDPGILINEWGLPIWADFGWPGPKTWDECAAMNWWIRDTCELLVIRADGHPAGFAVVSVSPTHLPADIKTDFELVDFYVAPNYRRQKIGQAAARQIFDKWRGAWVLFELTENAPALAFWHTFLDDYTGGTYEDLEDGTQQRFRNGT